MNLGMRVRQAIVLVGLCISDAGCRSSSPEALHFHAWGWEDAKAHLEHYKHILLACVFEDGWEDRGPNEYALYRFKGTVVRVYKGGWRVSERISLVHGLDYRVPAAPSSNAGELMFLFTNEHTDGEIHFDTGEFRDYDPDHESVLLSVYPPGGHVARSLGRPEAAGQADGAEPPSTIVLKALAKLGHLEGHPNLNTFYIPKKPNAGDLFVIYWKEKNVLFYYPSDGAPEIAEYPSLVRGHEYRVEEATFRRRADADYATSTYLESYGWALDRLVEAIVDGNRYELEYPHQ